MTDAIGWVATLFTMLGIYELAHKRMRGWWLFMTCNVLWGIVGFMSELNSLVVASVILGIGDLYGIHQWRNNA